MFKSNMSNIDVLDIFLRQPDTGAVVNSNMTSIIEKPCSGRLLPILFLSKEKRKGFVSSFRFARKAVIDENLALAGW